MTPIGAGLGQFHVSRTGLGYCPGQGLRFSTRRRCPRAGQRTARRSARRRPRCPGPPPARGPSRAGWPLGRPHRHRGVGRDLPGELERGRAVLAAGTAGGPARAVRPRRCRPGGRSAPGPRPGPGPGGATPARCTAAGHQPDRHLGQPEGGGVIGHHQVAGERQLAAAAEGKPCTAAMAGCGSASSAPNRPRIACRCRRMSASVRPARPSGPPRRRRPASRPRRTRPRGPLTRRPAPRRPG